MQHFDTTLELLCQTNDIGFFLIYVKNARVHHDDTAPTATSDSCNVLGWAFSLEVDGLLFSCVCVCVCSVA